MQKESYSFSLPIPVQRTLRKLGRDISDARKRRRVPTRVLAERASISRTTLLKLEKGDPGVSIGIFARVLFSLGMLDRLTDLADVLHDLSGIALDAERLPQRVRENSK